MSLRRKITTSGNSAALVLSQDLLGLMGVSIGDDVEVDLVDRTLVVRPISEAAREQMVERAIDDVFTRRRSLMKRLAGGAGDEPSPKTKR